MSAILNDVSRALKTAISRRRTPGLQYVVVNQSATVFEAYEGLADIASRPSRARRDDDDGVFDEQDDHRRSRPATGRGGPAPARRTRRQVHRLAAVRRRDHDPSASLAHVGHPQSDSPAMGASGAGTCRVRRARRVEIGHRPAQEAGVQAGHEVRLLEHRLLVMWRHRRAGDRTTLHVVRHAARARSRSGSHQRRWRTPSGIRRCTRRVISRSIRGSICSSTC